MNKVLMGLLLLLMMVPVYAEEDKGDGRTDTADTTGLEKVESAEEEKNPDEEKGPEKDVPENGNNTGTPSNTGTTPAGDNGEPKDSTAGRDPNIIEESEHDSGKEDCSKKAVPDCMLITDDQFDDRRSHTLRLNPIGYDPEPEEDKSEYITFEEYQQQNSVTETFEPESVIAEYQDVPEVIQTVIIVEDPEVFIYNEAPQVVEDVTILDSGLANEYAQRETVYTEINDNNYQEMNGNDPVQQWEDRKEEY